MPGSNGNGSVVEHPIEKWAARFGIDVTPRKPETGSQSQDGEWVSSSNMGQARLTAGQGKKVEPEHPLVKFRRVWSEEFAGSSGTEHLTGQ